MDRGERPEGWWIFLLSAPAAVLGFYFVSRYGVSVPWGDQWEIVLLFDKYFSGTLTFSDLFNQHNEHRILFPRLVMLALGFLTKYDTVAEMYVIALGILGTALILGAVFRKAAGRRRHLWFFLPVPFLLFSYKQYENTLWGFQIGFIFVQALSVLALYFLDRLAADARKPGLFVAAAAGAAVSSFSVAHGLLAWPAGFLQLLIEPIDRTRKSYYCALWFALGALTWALYFRGYVKPGYHPPLSYVLIHPFETLEFFFVLVGGSLCWLPGNALWLGIFLSALFTAVLIVLFRRSQLGGNAFWIGISVLSLLILASITVGRAGFGVEYANESRYVTYSVLAVAGIYLLVVRMAASGKGIVAAAPVAVVLAILAATIPTSYHYGRQAGELIRQSRMQMAYILFNYRMMPDDILRRLYAPSGAEVRRRAPILEKLGYNVFFQNR